MSGINPSAKMIMGAMMALGLFVASASHAEVSMTQFGHAGSESVEIYTLANKRGLEVRVMTYGATVVSIKAPDRSGVFKNVVLGFDSLENYIAGVPYFGATVGRFANRVAHARFTLDGVEHRLPANDKENSLHGGKHGFDKHVWSADVPAGTHNVVRLTYVSADGEEGYPGQLTAHVTYTLSEDDTLEIRYQAETTAPTPINLANHAYFNLTGDFERSILDHTLQIDAESYTPVDASLIPTGEKRSVAMTPFDFRHPTAIGSRIGAADEQLARGHGYDHNWILKRTHKGSLETAAVLTDPGSGRTLTVRTSQPGLQFYSGNFMDGKKAGAGSVYQYRTGLCLETQHFPDSPNQPAFPSSILRPGESYVETTTLHFGTSKR